MPYEKDTEMMGADMSVDDDFIAQLDRLAAEYPKLKKDVKKLQNKLSNEMPMDDEYEDEDKMMAYEDEEMEYDDEDLDSILG